MDLSLLEWSRAQIALTAAFHWIFVPLALGLTFMIAIMETVYVKTGNTEWKRHLTFWMKIFGVNFALCVASGLIVVFELAANWSNCSWFAGDVLNVPLITVILVFFIEISFLKIMFFGWDRISKKMHLISTWLVVFGALLSSMLILVIDAWMQHPVGINFNIETTRLEMNNFWEILFSPVAVSKFLHTVASGFVLTSVFVIGVNAWLMLKKREQAISQKSMRLSAIVGLLSSLFLLAAGVTSLDNISKYQPVKFVALEARLGNTDDYTPTIDNLTKCSEEFTVMSAEEKIERGKAAHKFLKEYMDAKQKEDETKVNKLHTRFNDSVFHEYYFKYYGYGFLDSPVSVIPNIPLTYWSFRVMVGLGFYFVVLFVIVLCLTFRDNFSNRRFFLWLFFLSIPLPYIAGEAGWIVSEAGRQPWVIQDYLTSAVAVSQLETGAVKTTFWLFAVLLVALLIAGIFIIKFQLSVFKFSNSETETNLT
jgi:cytochrome d ubiquinol oxidase subunit I